MKTSERTIWCRMIGRLSPMGWQAQNKYVLRSVYRYWLKPGYTICSSSFRHFFCQNLAIPRGISGSHQRYLRDPLLLGIRGTRIKNKPKRLPKSSFHLLIFALDQFTRTFYSKICYYESLLTHSPCRPDGKDPRVCTDASSWRDAIKQNKTTTSELWN